MAYNAVIYFAGSRADSLCGLLCRSLERYSEYEHDLCKQEHNDGKNANYVACDLEKRNCNSASDDTARKNRAGCRRILYELTINAGFPQKRKSLKRGSLAVSAETQALEIAHIHRYKSKQRRYGYEEKDDTSDSDSRYALSLLEKNIQSNIEDIDRNGISCHADKS